MRPFAPAWLRVVRAGIHHRAAAARPGRAALWRPACALRVGGAISENFLASAFAKLREEAPRATLSITVSDNDVMVPALREGELDLIVNYYMTIQTEGILCEHLYYDDYVVCAAADHRLTGR